MAAKKKAASADTLEVGVSADHPDAHTPETDPLVGPDGRRYATEADAQALRDGGGPLAE